MSTSLGGSSRTTQGGRWNWLVGAGKVKLDYGQQGLRGEFQAPLRAMEEN